MFGYVLSCFLARHAALPHSGFGMGNNLNKWEMSGKGTAKVSEPAGEQRGMNDEGDGAQGGPWRKDKESVCV